MNPQVANKAEITVPKSLKAAMSENSPIKDMTCLKALKNLMFQKILKFLNLVPRGARSATSIQRFEEEFSGK